MIDKVIIAVVLSILALMYLLVLAAAVLHNHLWLPKIIATSDYFSLAGLAVADILVAAIGVGVYVSIADEIKDDK